MARISDEDIDRVRTATDLVQLAGEHVELKRRGRSYWGCCPFHGEKTPSFKIDPDTQLWHCFGCGRGGTVFSFIMEAGNMEFPDAVRYLADRAHIQITEEGGRSLPQGYKERLKALMGEAAGFYGFALRRNPSDQASQARSYLAGRGFGSDVCRRWELGFAPGHDSLVRHLTKKGYSREEIIDSNMALELTRGQRARSISDRFFNRIMFPIHDAQGATIAFGGRVIGKTPPNTGKYINTANTPIFNKRRNMFAFDRAKGSITAIGTAVVVEGYTDVIALHEAGITNVVATLGTSLTPEHLRLLRMARPKRIVYLFDGDEAGQKAADRAAGFVDISATMESGREYVELLVAVIPGGQDPAEYVAAAGADAMRQVIADASPLMRFAIDRRLSAWDLTSPEQRTRALDDIARLLAPIKGTLASDDYANYVADLLRAHFDTVRAAFIRAKPLPRREGPYTTYGNAAGKGWRSHAGGDSGRDRDSGAPRRQEAITFRRGAQQEGFLPNPPQGEAQQVEREVIALAVRNPQLIGGLRESFAETPWSQPAVAMLAAEVIGQDLSQSPAQMAASLDRAVPGAAAYISGSTLDPDALGGEKPAARRMLTRLKELDLMRRIRFGNEVLQRAALRGECVDNTLFTDVAKLQQELNTLHEDGNV